MSGRYELLVCLGCMSVIGRRPARVDAIVPVSASKHNRCPGPWIEMDPKP